MYKPVVIAITIVSSAIGGVYIPDPGLKAGIEQALGKSDPSADDMLLLTHLSAGSRQIEDLTGIEYATNLQSLYLASNRITDLQPLSGLYNLCELDLSRNQISDIAALRGLVNLENLDLDYNRIADIQPLSGLDRLYRLDLDSNLIENLSPIAGLLGLEELWLSSNRISDIGPLASLSRLKRLDLEGNRIDDLSAVSGLSGLEELWLGSNRIDDIGPIADLVGLRRLDLGSNLIQDVSAISRLGSLETLDISGNTISSIDALSSLTGLWYLDISNNLIRSISPISGLVHLSTLDIGGNPWDAQTCLVYIPQMLSTNSNLTIRGNPCDKTAVIEIIARTGGHVSSPGEGTFVVERGDEILLEAVPEPGYRFSHWSGSVSGSDNPLALTVDASCQVTAHFISILDRLFVDDDARGKGRQDGTAGYPFSSIQQAVEVAANGAAILVRPGRYEGSIDLLGKSVILQGGEPNDPNLSPWPVVTTVSGPAMRFTHGEGPDCRLTGFVITCSKGNPAAAIWCSYSSPVISHCLIVGNGAGGDSRSIIYCQASSAQFLHCTIADNMVGQFGGCIYLVDSPVVIRNCIVWGNVGRVLVVEGGGAPRIEYSDIEGGWEGVGNMMVDPLFARLGRWSYVADGGMVWEAGDYHLRSAGGRWDSDLGAWVVDGVSSGCIDGGDPGSGVGFEGWPNGGRVNLGAYGGTTQASRSP